MARLWLVEIHSDDFEYDAFVSGVVWAETPEEAERLIRETQKYLPRGGRTRLNVTEAPTSGVVHTHWHAG